MIKKLSTLVIILLLIACGSAKLMTPTQADADRGAKLFPGYTLADLNQGKEIYEKNCNKCHGYKDPMKKKDKKWVKVVPKMAKKADLDSLKGDAILKYVLTMRAALPEKK